MKRILPTAWLVLLALLAASCNTAPVATAPPQLKVITSGGFAAAYNVLGPQFEQRTGIRVTTEYGSSSGGAVDSIPSRLARGEDADVIILSRSSLDRLTEKGEVIEDSRINLVRSSIGMAVRSGTAKPDISTSEAFIRTVMDAESIGYSASASGTYLSQKLFPKLGIWEQIAPKSKRILSERVATVVARGEVQIGFQQISEILPIEGVDYVGPIPEEMQKVTTFGAGILTRAQNPGEAEALLEYLSSMEVASTIAQTGLQPVVLEK